MRPQRFSQSLSLLLLGWRYKYVLWSVHGQSAVQGGIVCCFLSLALSLSYDDTCAFYFVCFFPVHVHAKIAQWCIQKKKKKTLSAEEHTMNKRHGREPHWGRTVHWPKCNKHDMHGASVFCTLLLISTHPLLFFDSEMGRWKCALEKNELS